MSRNQSGEEETKNDDENDVILHQTKGSDVEDNEEVIVYMCHHSEWPQKYSKRQIGIQM